MKKVFTIPLPALPPVIHPDYPRARNVANAYTASERLPSCFTDASDEPALYRFYIFDGPTLVRFYVGETLRFATRMGHYCGMTRRLLLLKQRAERVVLEKHPMRHVHFFLAEALCHPRHVEIEWTSLSSTLTKTQRVAAESDEQRRLQIQHPYAALIGGRGTGNFETNPQRPLSVVWNVVHGRLLTCPDRTKRKPPFVI